MPGLRGLITGVSACVVVACGSDGDTASSAGDFPTIPIAEDLRLDGYTEDLVPVQWAGVSPGGGIAILQWQDHSVRFYDTSGTLLGSVGRQGEGPGEFRRLVRAGWIADTLWISDTQIRRSTLIGPGLEVVRTVPYHENAEPARGDTVPAYQGPSPYAMFADGGSIVWALRRADGMPIDAGTGPPLLRLSRDGHIENRVAGIASDEAGYVSFSVANGTAGSIIPFYPQLAWTVSPHGMRVGLLTTDMQAAEPYFRVIVVDDRGARVVDRSFTFMPEPIPDAVRDSAIHARAFSRSDTTVSRDIESALRDATPRVYPSATQILIGTDDRIWIGMRPTADGTRWRVLSPAGDPQGEILLPPRVRLRDAGAEYVLCTERDEFDVESVVRYRIGAARATDR